jgi:hypothetical protein
MYDIDHSRFGELFQLGLGRCSSSISIQMLCLRLSQRNANHDFGIILRLE